MIAGARAGPAGAEAGGRPDLSIVVVNWNTRQSVLECLESIRRARASLALEVVVVDNGSPDKSAEAIATAFPEFRLIANRRNAGFARANNLAFRHCRGRYILLLNPDTEARVDSLRGLVEFMDRTPDAGAAGLQLRHPDGRRQNSYDSFPALATELLSKHLLRWLFPKRYPSKLHVPDGPMPVDVVIGACLILRPEIVERLDGFDEGYFLFVEEADLCRRIRDLGWKIYHLPDLDICHSFHYSKEQAPAHATIESYRSSYRYFRKHRSAPVALAFRVLKGLKLLVISLPLSVIAVAATLGRSPRHARRLRVRGLLSLWHVLGCPRSWGMRQVSEFRGYRRMWTPVGGSTVASIVEDGIDRGDLARLESLVARDDAAGFVETKRGRHKTQYRLDDAAGGALLVTVHRARHVFAAWLARLGISDGVRSFERAIEVADQGVRTLLPAAAGEVRRGPALPASYIAFREVGGLSSLYRVLDRDAARPAARRAWIEAYGRFVRKLHDAGVRQQDLNPGNCLVAADAAPGDDDALICIDSERVVVMPPIAEAERIEALARLQRIGAGWTRADRLRFLRAYLGEGEGEARERRRAFVVRILDRMPALRRSDGARAARNCTRRNWYFDRLDRGIRGHFRRRAYPWQESPILDRDSALALARRALRDESLPGALEARSAGARGLRTWREANRAFQSGDDRALPLVFARENGVQRLIVAPEGAANVPAPDDREN